MIRWCSYCNIYLGEREPYEDFSLTHGICPDCKASLMNRKFRSDESSKAHQKKLANFYNHIRSSILSKNYVQSQALITEAKQLNISDIDLLFGVFQPILYEVGRM